MYIQVLLCSLLVSVTIAMMSDLQSGCAPNCDFCFPNGSEMICGNCIAGFALDMANQCVACPDGCKMCYLGVTGEAVCSVCDQGQGVNNAGQCQFCPVYCLDCYGGQDSNGGSRMDCMICEAGYIGAQCLPDTPVCSVECSSCYYIDDFGTLECSVCAPGYGLDLSNQCAPCPASCNECTIDPTGGMVCQICANGFGTDFSSQCQSCPMNCNECYGSQDITGGERMDCLMCKPGFIGVQCLPEYPVCPMECESCYYMDDAGSLGCSMCVDGFTLDFSNQCMGCPMDCSSCYPDGSGSLACAMCNHGYGINMDNQCEVCPVNCQDCMNSLDEVGAPIMQCLTCEANFVNVGPQCLAENPVCGPDCQLCGYGPAGGVECYMCAEGYGLDLSNQCTNCPMNCYDCYATSDGTGVFLMKCMTCYPGFTGIDCSVRENFNNIAP